MKTIRCLFFLVVLFNACSDFLDTELKGEYTSDNYYTTAESATMAVTAIYHSLYGNTLWVFGDVASDDAVKGGTPGDQADINAIDDFSANSENGFLSAFWKSSYETVARANNAITYIAPMDIDAPLRDRLVGEAKFLRAYTYFNLVNIFGKVPLKLKPQLTYATIHVGLSETSAIYTLIEKDLSEAIPVLPTSYTTEAGRITKGAAYALLAKSALYRNDYATCLANIQLLEDLHQYDLVANYAHLFKAGAEDSLEFIFGIRYANNAIYSRGNNLNVWFAPAVPPENGYYFNAPTQQYVDAFIDTTVDGRVDPRLDASIGRDGQPWFNNMVFSAAWSEATGYLVKKYNTDTVTGVTKDQTTMPYHAIRYADILLMKAEALNEQGGTDAIAKASLAVNRVRSRAHLTPTTATTQETLRAVIRNERRKELGFEFHRFFDLMRWGQATAEAALGSQFTWTAPRFYFPIPQSELDSNQAL